MNNIFLAISIYLAIGTLVTILVMISEPYVFKVFAIKTENLPRNLKIYTTMVFLLLLVILWPAMAVSKIAGDIMKLTKCVKRIQARKEG